MLKQLETAILDKVRSLAAGSRSFVKDFPDKPSNLETVVPNGQVLVGYKRSTFNLIQNFYPITMTQNVEFEVSLQLKNLRTHNGIYSLIDVIRFGLIGFVPLQGIQRGMYPISESFVSFDQGIWYYSQVFVVPLLIVEGEDPFEPIEPLPPFNLTGIKIDLWRSNIDHLTEPSPESVLVKEINIEVNN